MRRRIVRAILTLSILLCCVSLATACPNCKDGLADGTNNSNLVRGFGWSIIFMMSAPFLILGGLGGYFYYEICKARRNQAATKVAHDGLEAAQLASH